MNGIRSILNDIHLYVLLKTVKVARVLPPSHTNICKLDGFQRKYLVEYSMYSLHICHSYLMAQSLSTCCPFTQSNKQCPVKENLLVCT